MAHFLNPGMNPVILHLLHAQIHSSLSPFSTPRHLSLFAQSKFAFDQGRRVVLNYRYLAYRLHGHRLAGHALYSPGAYVIYSFLILSDFNLPSTYVFLVQVVHIVGFEFEA